MTSSPGQQTDFILKTFVVGPMAVNCYLVADSVSKEACLIDPGAEGEKIKKFIDKNGYSLKFILNTHGHGDHIGANGYLGSPIYIHESDKDFLTDPEKNLSKMFMFGIKSPQASRILHDGDTVDLGTLRFEVMHTPGHTPGSISVRLNGVVFTGDTLFCQGVGRTDFSYGDEAKLYKSIHTKLMSLPDDTVVYPGHGDSSTIGAEKRTNPFLV